MDPNRDPFWKIKSLKEMTKAEWELLCDNCGLCCLHKLRDGKTGKIKLIAVSCKFLDTSTCRCLVYENRKQIDPDCLVFSPNQIKQLRWLPFACAYRCIAEGRELEWWHPLNSGDPNTVHIAGISVQNKVVSGNNVNLEDLDVGFFDVMK